MVEGYPDPLNALPLLFSVKGQQTTETIYMSVTNWDGACPACHRIAYDNRGTVFRCCGTMVCSKCTDIACSNSAERLHLDLRRTLTNSGRVLQKVHCPACKAVGDVGFPINSEFRKVFFAKSVYSCSHLK
jgi:hypothetical protein